jgi:hypothetical protein
VSDKKLADQLEEFQKELNAVADDKDQVDDLEPGKQDDVVVDDLREGEGEVTENDDDSGQKADDNIQDSESGEGDPDPKDPDQKDASPTLTTLPDDAETFGELAGKQVTAEQLIEAGLLTKLVTWGHQGRHMVKKGQDDISEAKALRELLQERFQKQDADAAAAAEASKPKLSEKQYADQLVQQYMPDFERVVAEGGIEEDFIKDFPMAAAHIENRFQSGSELLQGIIGIVDELYKIVIPGNEQTKLQQANAAFDGKIGELADTGGLFENLEDSEKASAFKDWVTSEESGLRITEKEVGQVTQQDLQSAFLLYVHSHPEVLKAVEEKKETDAHLAGGGAGSSGTSKSKSARPTDDLSTFIGELANAQAQAWDED